MKTCRSAIMTRRSHDIERQNQVLPVQSEGKPDVPSKYVKHLTLDVRVGDQAAGPCLILRLRLTVLILGVRLPRKHLVIAQQIIRIVERPFRYDSSPGPRLSDIPRAGDVW